MNRLVVRNFCGTISQKVAVITGGASGIGLALAKRALASNYRLVLADIDHVALQNAAAELRSPDKILTMKCDVTVENDIKELAEKTFSHFGAVHLLCNNAGVGLAKLSWEHTTQDWEWVLGVNMWSIIHSNRYFIPKMLKQNEPCRILNTASAAGLVSTPGMIAYNVSKHAVVTMSETLDQELRGIDAEIRVSVLCPAFIPTGIAQSDRNRAATMAGSDPSGSDKYEPLVDYDDGLLEASQRLNRKYAAGLVQAVQSGKKTADDIALYVFEAMQRGDFYIIPHKKILGAVTLRYTDIQNMREPTITVP